MSEREDVEALAKAVVEIVETTPRFKAKAHVEIELTDWLATHDEQVRAEALAPVRARAEEWTERDDIDPALALRLYAATGRADRAALPPERLAGEVGAE